LIRIVVANKENQTSGAPYLFRTYPHTGDSSKIKNPGEADRFEIWEVARATSAAPSYFQPMVIGTDSYYDGGVGNNNPVTLTTQEVRTKERVKTANQALSILISIGTGLKPTTREVINHRFPRISEWGPLKKISKEIKNVLSPVTDSENHHNQAVELFEATGFDQYYRWNGGEEVGGLKLDEWHEKPKKNNFDKEGDKLTTAQFIRRYVDEFMKRPEIATKVKQAAQQLVNQRRARIAYLPEHGLWHRFAHCTEIQCPFCQEEKWCPTRRELCDHIRLVHGKEPNMEEVNRYARRPPRFKGGPL
jgi:hypothetical protein